MLRIRLALAAAAVAASAALLAQGGPAKPPASPADLIDPALAERVDGKQSPDDVRIDAMWRRGTEIVGCRVYGTGVGIWRDKTQFSLTKEEFLGLLKELRSARFGAMPKYFGSEGPEGDDEEEEREKKEKEGEKEKVYLRGSLAVRVGPDSKRVAQFVEGDQDKKFAALVARVLSVSEKAADRGQTIPSLSDGLAEVANGKLASETLQIMAQRGAGPGASGGADAGWVLRVDGRRVVDRSARGVPQAARVLQLSENDFKHLASLLHANDVANLPRNLYSNDTVRLDLRVLDRRADLTARRYAGKTAASLGAKQEAFDRVWAALTALHERAAREGAETSPTVE